MMTLTSPSIADNGQIDARCTCDGANQSPELRWTDAPAGARAFALIVDDPDAPSGRFTHWALFDVPASVHELAEGSVGVGTSGRNDFRKLGYGGPCPPYGDSPHRYRFRLYALDVDSLELPEGATREEIEEAMANHMLDQAELAGRYARAPAVRHSRLERVQKE